MSFLRHPEIYRPMWCFSCRSLRATTAAAPTHRLDEFPTGYSLAGRSPAEPASASPAGHQYAIQSFCRSRTFQRTVNSVLTVCVSSGGKRKFWQVYAAGDARGFARILRRLEGRIHSWVDDKRTRQLLLDAIAWGIANPEPLLEGTRSPLDSPNVVALTLLIHELHRANQDDRVLIKTFIHDEQQQFGKHLKTAFDVSKRFGNVDSTSPLALMINMKQMATFDCEFRSTSSATSFGLQVLDVALWLMKRFTDEPDTVQGACRELAELVSNRGFVSEFTEESLLREVARGLDVVMSRPITPEQERKGRDLLRQFEASRLERMRASLPSSNIVELPASECN